MTAVLFVGAFVLSFVLIYRGSVLVRKYLRARAWERWYQGDMRGPPPPPVDG